MTYEEYFELVKEGLDFYLRPYKLSDAEIIKYMLSQEDVIRKNYEKYNKDYESGKITLRQFREGGVSGVVYTLHLLY